MTIVMKALALVEGGQVTDEHPHGEFDVILSAPTLDRDDEVVDTRAFEPLPDHIPFDIDHGMSVQTTVGSGRPYYDLEGNLRVAGTFASTPLAQEVRTLVKEGHIRTTSVTFMAATREKDEKGVQHVKQAELLNGTFTPVPSNRESVVLASKALAVKEGRRNNATDAQTIQQAHDMMVSLGADCSGKSVDDAEGKDAKQVSDDDPNALIQAADAALDEALDLLNSVDTSGLPAEVQQALALVQAADESIDSAVELLGLPDPDETPKSTDDATGKATTTVAAEPAAESADMKGIADDLAARLGVNQNAALFAFGR